MSSDLSGKNALVTGAGKRTGIGFAIAKKLASRGANIIIADLGRKSESSDQAEPAVEDEARDIADELGEEFQVKALAVAVDVTDNVSIEKMVSSVKEEFDSIQILVNNAGAVFGVPNGVHTYDENEWMKTIDVNLHSVFRISRAILPLMSGTGGSVVNIASRAAKVPPLFNGAYAVAKAGVVMLTKVMALELGASGIRFNAVCPGLIDTDLHKWRVGLEMEFFNQTYEEREAELVKSIPLGRVGSPDEAAELVAFLASDESAYMTGQAVNVTGGQLMEL